MRALFPLRARVLARVLLVTLAATTTPLALAGCNSAAADAVPVPVPAPPREPPREPPASAPASAPATAPAPAPAAAPVAEPAYLLDPATNAVLTEVPPDVLADIERQLLATGHETELRQLAKLYDFESGRVRNPADARAAEQRMHGAR